MNQEEYKNKLKKAALMCGFMSLIPFVYALYMVLFTEDVFLALIATLSMFIPVITFIAVKKGLKQQIQIPETLYNNETTQTD